MKFFFLFLVSTLWVSIASAQTPIDVIFKKYSDKNGVIMSTDNITAEKDGESKATLTTIIKTMSIEKDEDEKKVAKLFRKALKDCNKILNKKGYNLISIDKDDDSSNKVYKYESGTVIEICELEQDEDELTLTVTQISGLPKEMKENFKIKTEHKTIGAVSF